MVISQSVYVVDAIYMESAILTTIDITTDGFGFMLAFGDVVWLPFTYSLQAKYLSVHPVSLGPLYVLMILGVQLAGILRLPGQQQRKESIPHQPKGPFCCALDIYRDLGWLPSHYIRLVGSSTSYKLSRRLHHVVGILLADTGSWLQAYAFDTLPWQSSCEH